MGLYAIVLAGGGYCGPLIFGFIADGAGFEWCFYTATILAVVGFFILFFLLEETNYVRQPIEPITEVPLSEDTTKEHPPSETSIEVESSETHRKSYLQRLAVWHPTPGLSMLGRVKLSFYYFSWPIVVYTG